MRGIDRDSNSVSIGVLPVFRKILFYFSKNQVANLDDILFEISIVIFRWSKGGPLDFQKL